jgi:hypothetical protein
VLCRLLLTERLLVGFEHGVLNLLEHHIAEVFLFLHLLLCPAHLLPCLLILIKPAHILQCLSHPLHVVEEVFRAAMAIPHGLTALHAVRELNLDGWDLSVRIQVVEPLRNIGDGRTEAAIVALYVVALETFGDLVGEGHSFGFLED